MYDYQQNYSHYAGQNREFLPGENLGDASVADSELSCDIAWTDPPLGHINDLLPNGVRKWSTIYVHSTELVNTTIS